MGDINNPMPGQASLHDALSGESKTWECLRCGRFFNIPASLTPPGGAFAAEAQGHSEYSLRGATDMLEIAVKFRDMNQFKTRKKGA